MIVDIIVLKSVNELLNQNSINVESGEIVNGIILWKDLSLGLGIILVTCVFNELAYFIHKVRAILSLVSNIANHKSLSCNGWDQSVLKKKHHSIEVEDFN